MNKLLNFTKKRIDYLEKLIVILTIFSSIFITGIFGIGKYGSIFNYSLCVLLIIYLVAFVMTRRNEINIQNKFLILILVYLFCNFVSIVLNEGKIDNLKLFIYSIAQWFVLFMCYKNHKKFTSSVLNLSNYCIFIITTLGLYFFVINFWVSNFGERFCGLYENPNTGAAISFLSIGLSLFLLSTPNKWKKLFLIMNILFQICSMRLCMSRASNIAVIVLFAVFAALYAYLKKKNIFIAVAASLLLVLSCVFVYNTISPKIYNIRDYVLHKDDDVVQKEESTGKSNEVYVDVRDSEDEAVSDSYRLSLLNAGFRTTLERPIFGYGQSSLAQAVSENSNIRLEGIKGGGVHNSYLEILIANGFVGFLSFASILFLLTLNIIWHRKRLLNLRANDEIIRFCACFSIFICFLIYGMFESVLVLNGSVIANIFILTLGGLRYEK